eukprot:CAMPEP_0177762316 /NCGR_PEP_ID=MMETSP0491_2-20121128/6281_1 /TAXON_ID=63592 /ORGANISM="Tetraselmis chuii, Strain PLY429" /LENGTH=58 /DNA_ID=CAMNT_0019278365 /DNA_START=563 /DNA_END=739 /DNA_ORIENTATION=-
MAVSAGVGFAAARGVEAERLTAVRPRGRWANGAVAAVLATSGRQAVRIDVGDTSDGRK